MPTYEYLCGKCGKFEEMQSIKAPSLSECPTCHGPVSRIISGGSGLIFKGSGFYLTDNRSTDYKAKEKADKAAPTTSAGADAGTSVKNTGETSSTAGKPAESAASKPAPAPSPAPAKPPSNESKHQP